MAAKIGLGRSSAIAHSQAETPKPMIHRRALEVGFEHLRHAGQRPREPVPEAVE
jgi:hypothetical protein